MFWATVMNAPLDIFSIGLEDESGEPVSLCFVLANICERSVKGCETNLSLDHIKGLKVRISIYRQGSTSPEENRCVVTHIPTPTSSESELGATVVHLRCLQCEVRKNLRVGLALEDAVEKAIRSIHSKVIDVMQIVGPYGMLTMDMKISSLYPLESDRGLPVYADTFVDMFTGTKIHGVMKATSFVHREKNSFGECLEHNKANAGVAPVADHLQRVLDFSEGVHRRLTSFRSDFSETPHVKEMLDKLELKFLQKQVECIKELKKIEQGAENSQGAREDGNSGGCGSKRPHDP